MPVFIIATRPNGTKIYAGQFTDRVPALEYIRKRQARKSLAISEYTFTIYSLEGGETFNEEWPA